MKIGYARVSTKDQNLDIQLHALKKAGCRRIYQEKVSGVGRNRPEFQKMIEHLREDDVLIIWRLDRLARSTKMLLEIIEQLKEKGVSFRSIEEPWADTTSATGRMLMTFFSGLAEFERDLIRDRTSAGRTAALERGVKFGRPMKMTDEQLKLARKLLRQGKSIHYVASTFGVHFTTLYRYLREARM